MLTNILEQDFTNFAKNIEKKGVDTLLDYYVQRVSDNETTLVTQYAAKLLDNKAPHIPDPRIYLRQNLLALVQDSYALGIADGYKALEDVQFSYEKTVADFALDPNDKLQRDINKLQSDIVQSQNIVRQTKTLNQYTKTLQGLQNQAQTLENTQATQTLEQLSQQLQALKTSNTVRAATGLINKQLDKGNKQRADIIDKIDEDISNAQKIPTEDDITGQKTKVDLTPDTQDYLIKRAIEEKLKYLQNRKDTLANTPPVVLDEDKDFFRWYAQKRIVPIANRYQQGIVDKNSEVKAMMADYTEKINKGTITQAAKGDYQQRIINKILNIEGKVKDNGQPIKRVQRVVATELAIAYNVGRLKTYLKAGIQYVTISTSMYSSKPCDYCIDTEQRSLQQPIKISSLLKNAYRNDGFKNKTAYEAGRNIPIEQRYLVSHPFCMCVYIPNSKKDDVQEPESQGVYADPNSWKFILGAGLGVSLVFLAFALTTGRKLDIPTTIPSLVPRIKLPVVRRDNAPDTVPVDVEPLRTPGTLIPDLRQAMSFRDEYRTILQKVDELSLSEKQKDAVKVELYGVIRDKTLPLMDQLLRSQLIVEKASTPEYAKKIIDDLAKQRGFLKQLYFTRFDIVADKFNNRISPEGNINKLKNKVRQVLSKVDGDAVINTANNIEKTSLDAQNKPIYLLRSDLAGSLQRVLNKANKKESDLNYIEDLEYRIRDLDNFTAILQRQKREIQNIRDSVVIVDKPMLMQQISNTQATVDRLSGDSSLLQEAVEQYQDLLEMLLALPVKEADKYKKIQTDLNRRIKSAQGITLKRFVGDIVEFRYTNFYLS